MIIFVRTFINKKISLDVKATDSIESIKAKLQETEGVSPDQMRLVLSGKDQYSKLEDDKSLKHYNIQKETLLHMDPQTDENEPVLTNKQRRALKKKLKEEAAPFEAAKVAEEKAAKEALAAEFEAAQKALAEEKKRKVIAAIEEAAIPTKKAKKAKVTKNVDEEESSEPSLELKKGKGPKIIIAQKDEENTEPDENKDKPDENKDTPLSKSQRIRLKRLQREKLGFVHETKPMLNGRKYLEQWKHCKDEWKFNKNNQNWLLNHVFDKRLIPDSLFELILEYIPTVRGGIRDALKKRALQKATQSKHVNSLKDVEMTEEVENTEKEEKKKKKKKKKSDEDEIVVQEVKKVIKEALADREEKQKSRASRVLYALAE